MAVTIAAESILLSALKARTEKFNLNTIVHFREGDVLKVVEESFEARENSSTKLPVFTQYRMELTRNGARFMVWTTLGVFLGLPLSKNGFSAEAADAQRMLSNNAIFSGFEMRPAEEILESLKKGVKCSKVYTSATSSSRCYRWVTVWKGLSGGRSREKDKRLKWVDRTLTDKLSILIWNLRND